MRLITFCRESKSIESMNQPVSKTPVGHHTLLIVGVCLLGGFGLSLLLITWAGIHAFYVGETGLVTSREDWPDPLKSLAEELGETELDQASIQVYCLCQGFDPEYVWRMDAAPDLFEHIKDRWGLSRIEDPDWRVLDGSSPISGVATPDWWSLQREEGTSFFVSPNVLACEPGIRFQVALDEQRNVIFVHYWDPF